MLRSLCVSVGVALLISSPPVGAQAKRPFLGVSLSRGGNGGVLVNEVVSSSPAQAAGLLAGDVLLRFAGRTLHEPKDVTAALDAVQANSRVPCEIRRGSQVKTLFVSFGTVPALPSASAASPANRSAMLATRSDLDAALRALDRGEIAVARDRVAAALASLDAMAATPRDGESAAPWNPISHQEGIRQQIQRIAGEGGTQEEVESRLKKAFPDVKFQVEMVPEKDAVAPETPEPGATNPSPAEVSTTTRSKTVGASELPRCAACSKKTVPCTACLIRLIDRVPPRSDR